MNADRLPQCDLVSNESQPIGRWALSEPFPALLCDLDLQRVTGYGHSRFFILKKQGVFRFLEARPQLATKRTLYSGHLVAQWARGELGSSKYFQSAAKRGAAVVPIAGRRPGRPRPVSAGPAVSVHAAQSAGVVPSAPLKEGETR